VIGANVLARQRVEPFIDRQTELVSTFAGQAVIAIENTRLLTETREALEQQTATAELLQAINSSPGDPAPVFDAMLDKALRLCSAVFGALRTVDGDALHQVASRNLPPRYAEYWSSPVRLGPTNSVLGTAVFEQRTIQIEDMAAAESYHAGSSIAVAGVELGGVRTLVHVPLIKDNITLGVLTAFRQEVRLSPTRSFGCWKTSRPRR
jgi:two-component system, NtrC family, sensor kinase